MNTLDSDAHSRSLCMFSHVRLFVTPWTVSHRLLLELSRQEYWSGLPFPTPGNLPNPGIEPMSLGSPALAGGLFTTGPQIQLYEDSNTA